MRRTAGTVWGMGELSGSRLNWSPVPGALTTSGDPGVVESSQWRMFALVLRTGSGWLAETVKVCLAVLVGLPFWGHVPAVWRAVEVAGAVAVAGVLLWPGKVTALRYADGTKKLVLGAPHHQLLIRRRDRGHLAGQRPMR